MPSSVERLGRQRYGAYQSNEARVSSAEDTEEDRPPEIPIRRRRPPWFYFMAVGICIYLFVVLFANTPSMVGIPASEEESLSTSFACPLEDNVAYKKWDNVGGNFSRPILVYHPKSLARKKLPIVVFAHGMATSASNYKYLYCGLAKNGYIVAASYGPAPFWNRFNWNKFADELLPLAKKVNETFPKNTNGIIVAGGHSAGGGSALFAASGNERFNALFVLAPYVEEQKVAVEAAKNMSIPTLVIAAQKDYVVDFGRPWLVGGNANTIHKFLPNVTGKDGFLNITGAAHCGFCFECSLCHCAEWIACKAEKGILHRCEWITEAKQDEATLNELIPWLSMVL